MDASPDLRRYLDTLLLALGNDRAADERITLTVWLSNGRNAGRVRCAASFGRKRAIHLQSNAPLRCADPVDGMPVPPPANNPPPRPPCRRRSRRQ